MESGTTGIPGTPGPHPDSVRMPVIYLSHGAPPLADDELWTAQLADWAARLPLPRGILMISAHWESAPVALSRDADRPAGPRLLGLPRALLPGAVSGARSSRTR